jgi:maltose/moltooligosaccharide transporter
MKERPDAPSGPGHGWGYMTAMGVMVAGFVSVDAITNNMVPITARHFTDSPFLIAFLVALNRLFGFLVQPYVAWKSDRIRTRFGRRRPFLILGLPGTCVALLLLGSMPFVFQGESRQAMATLVLLLVANVALQFLQDVNWGAQEPLYADTFPHRRLGRAVAVRSYAIQFVYLFMNYYAMKWADHNEFVPYLCAAGLVLLSLFMVVFVIRERDFPPPATVERYNPLTHLSLLWHNADHAKVAVIGAFGLMLPAAFYLFHPLFVTRTLGLSKAQLGASLALVPVVALVVSAPVGWMIDRYGPKWITATGFLALAFISAAVAYGVTDQRGLTIAMCAFGAAQVVISLPMTSLVFQYATAGERGTVFGLIQFVRGFAAFVFSLVIGGIVQFSSSSDATPLYAEDIRQVAPLAAHLSTRSTPLAVYLHDRLSPELKAELAAAGDRDLARLRTRLAAELNRVILEPGLYAPDRFQDVALSRQSRRLAEKAPVAGPELAVLNRTLLEDAFREELSRQPDYRLSYLLSVVISLLGAVVTIRTRAVPVPPDTPPAAKGAS